MLFSTFLAVGAAVTSVSALTLPKQDTNGDRLSRGLPLKKPSRTFDASRKRQATPSGTTSSSLASVCKNPKNTYALSCPATGGDSCCGSPSTGGLLLQTQFWDSGTTSTGPANSFTVHGLWPGKFQPICRALMAKLIDRLFPLTDNCDGTYPMFCDTARQVSTSGTTVQAILQGYGETDLLSYMNTYWKDYQGNDETFWEHEFDKHGTCIPSLQPSCFATPPAISAHQDVHAYFLNTVALFKTLPTYDWLAAEGITPSFTATYTLAQIQAAIQKHRGPYEVNIQCSGTVFDEVWYFYNAQGGALDGNLVPVARAGSPSTCPATGIKWQPKYQPIPITTGTTLALYPFVLNDDGTTIIEYPQPSIITNAAWFYGTGSTVTTTQVNDASGNPIPGSYYLGLGTARPCAVLSATYAAQLNAAGGFVSPLTSVAANQFYCAAGVTPSVFTYDNVGIVYYNGQSTFSTTAVPTSGGARQYIFFGDKTATSKTINVQLNLLQKM